MLVEVFSSLFLLLGWVLVDYFFKEVYGNYDKGFIGLLEFFLVIFLVNVLSKTVFISNSIVLLFVSLFFGMVSSFFSKSLFLLFFKRFKPEVLIESKSFRISLVRSMRLEGVSKKKIDKIFKRLNVDVKSILEFFD